MRQRRLFILASLALLPAAAALAAAPPGLVNHQGVLRDASDRPLSGTYDMTFRFYDAAAGGNEILVDAHTAGGGSAVVVSGGLFDVALGGGTVSDGSGPGTYISLTDVFRDHASVHLSIQVGAETLSPRVRIVAAAYALNATNLAGRAAGEFLDTSAATQTKVGHLALQGGVEARGTTYGGFFADGDSSGYAYCGYADYGVSASGNTSGGYFRDRDHSGYAYVGYGDQGIAAYGNLYGGAFGDLDGSGYTRLASADTGIVARGNSMGGQFEDIDSSGLAYVAYANSGITAQGSDWGGRFEDTDGSGVAWVGYANTGIFARGDTSGGHFEDGDSSGVADCGYGNYGVYAGGSTAGLYGYNTASSGYGYVGFHDTGLHGAGTGSGVYGIDTDGSGYGYLGFNDTGVIGYGTFQGGYFVDDDSSGYARAGYGAYKILGSGTVSFVQNHPVDKDKVIVYAAPEGDEVATYTRGSARLVAGEARVALGETFAWVTNPDVGLTAHVTPVGAWSDLYVATKSTREIVVRSREGALDATFDYVVYGLRIGFEEISIVQEKDHESFIPSMTDHRALYERQPELRRFNALERHLAMEREVRGVASIDLSGASALKAAIHEYDPARHGPVANQRGRETGARLAEPPAPEAGAATPRPVAPEPAGPRAETAVATASEIPRAPADAEESASAATSVLLPVSEPVEAGDVLAVDPDRRGTLRRARLASDAGVVGVAAGPAADGVAPVATYGVASCKVDATLAPIAPGDLLAAAPTPGHAMRAASRDAGTIVAKALEPLEVGTGTILVLVMPR